MKPSFLACWQMPLSRRGVACADTARTPVNHSSAAHHKSPRRAAFYRSSWIVSSDFINLLGFPFAYLNYPVYSAPHYADDQVKRGVAEAKMVGYRFNTIGVSDAISMGTDGMSFSLQSRDLIADSIETVRDGTASAKFAGCHPTQRRTLCTFVPSL